MAIDSNGRSWLVVALLVFSGFVGCSGHGHRDNDFQDSKASGDAGDSRARDQMEIQADVSEVDGHGDLADSDVLGEDTKYHLASFPVPKDHVAMPWHVRQMPSNPQQPRLHAIPKRLFMLDDGKTLRVGFFWFNGYGEVIAKTDEPLDVQERKPAYCMESVDGLLPNSLLYYDIDTQTDEVTFVGAVVLSLIAAEQTRVEWSTTVEYLAVMDATAPQYSCTHKSDGRGFCLSIGKKEYSLEMCRYEPDYLHSPVSGVSVCVGDPPDHSVECRRGCFEVKAGVPLNKGDAGLSGFVDLADQTLHILTVHNLETGTSKDVPLTVAGAQISKAQALPSGCVEGNLEPDWFTVLGGDSPFYLLHRCHYSQPYFDHGSTYDDARQYESLEDYMSNHPTDYTPIPGGTGHWSGVGYPEAYFSPWEGDHGVFFFPRWFLWFQVNAAAGSGELKWEGSYDSMADSIGQMLPEYGPVGGSCCSDTFAPIRVPTCLLVDPDGSGWTGDSACVTWFLGWMKGNRATMFYRAENVDGQDLLKVHLDWSMEPLEDGWQETYGESLGAALPAKVYPPCQTSTYFAVPLMNYGARQSGYP